ncbi:MAG: CheB methylesterase domain-containing protein [Pseudomonadota bacterium]
MPQSKAPQPAGTRRSVSKSETLSAQRLAALRTRLHREPSHDSDHWPLLAIGASTGGPNAIYALLTQLTVRHCAVLITQHIAAPFLQSFAQRLTKYSPFHVDIAQDRAAILPGHCYLAPGDHHLKVDSHPTRLTCSTRSNGPVNGHCPSVDVMFQSLAQANGRRTVGVLLTGMGKDGAAGLGQLKNAGAVALVQDEASSAVWGMPGSAVQLGAYDAVLPLNDLPGAVSTLLTPPTKTPQ